MTMEKLNQNSPLHLADALADEIAKTPAEALLGEVTEDLGDRRALASEFDTVVARALHHSRRRQPTTAMKNGVAWLSQRLFGRPLLVRAGTLAALIIAVVGYHYHDEQRAAPRIESLNLQARSPQPARMATAFKDDPDGRPAAAPAKILSPSRLTSVSLPAQSDLQRALAAYDAARAYQARDRATAAFNRGDYPAAIASLNDALVSCAKHCQPDLRGALDSDLQRAQSAVKTVTVAAVAASPPPAQAAAVVPPAKSSPSLAWPVQGHITVSFGAGTTALASPGAPVQTAEGIMIAVPEDADIHAAANGVVSYVGADKGPGKFLLISHDNDLKTGYGHVRRVLVKVSDQVYRGEVIAKGVVASRGAKPQLYFEVHNGSAPVDPMQYLPHDQ
jgi:murein DD-endopeptidase MepM/ murein hydrolase activator NlpD